MQLTPDQRNTVAFSLGIAAERFEEDARECAFTYAFEVRNAMFHAMAVTFQLQAAEARKLADHFA